MSNYHTVLLCFLFDTSRFVSHAESVVEAACHAGSVTRLVGDVVKIGGTT